MPDEWSYHSGFSSDILAKRGLSSLTDSTSSRNKTCRLQVSVTSFASSLWAAYSSLSGLESLAFRDQDVRSHGHTTLDCGGSHVPQLVMIVSEEYDAATGTGVERRGCIADRVLYERNNLVIGDGGILAQRIEGAAGFCCLEERKLVGHVD